jgi:hypothetical protein
MNLRPTEPEPLCDVQAQLAALRNPAHPKRAVWVSASPGKRENPGDRASPQACENPIGSASPARRENPATRASPRRSENPTWCASPNKSENPVVGALVLPAGTLYGDDAVLRALERQPDDATLARLLDYIEPKSALAVNGDVGWLPVVQALDRHGFVVLEMVSSWHRIGEAKARAGCFGGIVRVVSMQACLERRRLLIEEEGRLLAGIRGKIGRE